MPIMELRLERITSTILLTSSLVLGAVACSSESGTAATPKIENTSSTTNPENGKYQRGYTQEDLLNEIGFVEFFATPEELAAIIYNYQQDYSDSGRDAITLLENRGITVSNYNTSYYGQDGIIPDSVSNLAVLPCRLIEMSGLRHITFIEGPKSTTIEQSLKYHLDNKEPIVSSGMVEAQDPYELSRAIASLILVNVPESLAVIEQFEEISKDAGVNYDPDFKIEYDIDKEGHVISNPSFPRKFEKIFDSQESIFSARIEFINMFSKYVYGTRGAYIHEPETPLGKKQSLLRDLYNQIVGDGGVSLMFNDLESRYGSHGLHPLDNVVRIRRIQKDISEAKTKEAKEQVIQDDFDLHIYDPKYPPDLTITKMAAPEPCKEKGAADKTEVVA